MLAACSWSLTRLAKHGSAQRRERAGRGGGTGPLVASRSLSGCFRCRFRAQRLSVRVELTTCNDVLMSGAQGFRNLHLVVACARRKTSEFGASTSMSPAFDAQPEGVALPTVGRMTASSESSKPKFSCLQRSPPCGVPGHTSEALPGWSPHVACQGLLVKIDSGDFLPLCQLLSRTRT